MLGLMTPPRFRASIPTNAWDDGPAWIGGSNTWRSMTRAGVTMSPEVALTYHAVFCALRVLAEGIGGVPLPCYERTANNDRRVATIDVASLMSLMPNPTMTAGVYREGRVAHQAGWGNAFSEVERNPRTGRPVALWPIHPSRVTPSREHPGNYMVACNSAPPEELFADQMLHIPGPLSDDGIWGRDTIAYGMELIGGSLATERAAHSFLGSGGQPKGVVEIPGLQDRQKRAAFREEWREVHGKPESNEPTIALVAPGTKYTPFSISNEANQMIQTQQANKSNIATLFKIPAFKIGAEGKETAGTLEAKAVDFVVHSLLPLANKIEDQLGWKLFTDQERPRFYFEHNFHALLRGDPVARYNAFRIAFSIGVLSINEIRRLENMNAIGPAGDLHFIPANMTTTDRAMQGDMGNGGRLGSDHSGLPADDPTDRDQASADPDRAHAAWLKGLTHTQRDYVQREFKALAYELPERPMDHVEHARLALTETLGRMLTKESNAATRAAKAGGDFDRWLREFYGEHQATLQDALRVPCDALRIAGCRRWADRLDLADWLRARSTEAIAVAYNTDTPETFARKLAAWPTERAKALAEEILGAK